MVTFVVWIVFIRLKRKTILNHKKVCQNKDCYNVVMFSDGTKILEFNQNQKSNEALFIIYADLEPLMEKIDECKRIP